MILPGKIKFNEPSSLNFVTYGFEGFRGNKTNILNVFIEKYTQIHLSFEKKKLLYDSIKQKLQNEKEDLLKILFSTQFLIYHLSKETRKENEEIKLIIEELPDNIKISEECVDFFNEQKLKIEELLDVFSIIELLCIDPIINNLRKYYKLKIDVNSGERILKLFDEKKFKIITKQSLSSACRKLISRYLAGERDDTDYYYENNKLVLYLSKEDIWPIEIWKNEDDLNPDFEILGNERLILGQSYELYNLLGDEEKNILEGNIMKNKVEK